VIFKATDEGKLKTRVCSKWLEERGFRTRLMERPFDLNFRCRTVKPQAEPRLALCGFDSNPARRDLQTAGFARVMEEPRFEEALNVWSVGQAWSAPSV
jgi:hypothetical protein